MKSLLVFFLLIASVHSVAVNLPESTYAEILKMHNDLRASYGIAPLQLSPQLNDFAQRRAETLTGQCILNHNGADPYGENLAVRTGFDSSLPILRRLITMWINEDINQLNHLTQMLWSGSQRIGCAVSYGCGSTYLACNYDPPGNIRGLAFNANARPISSLPAVPPSSSNPLEQPSPQQQLVLSVPSNSQTVVTQQPRAIRPSSLVTVTLPLSTQRPTSTFVTSNPTPSSTISLVAQSLSKQVVVSSSSPCPCQVTVTSTVFRTMSLATAVASSRPTTSPSFSSSLPSTSSMNPSMNSTNLSTSQNSTTSNSKTKITSTGFLPSNVLNSTSLTSTLNSTTTTTASMTNLTNVSNSLTLLSTIGDPASNVTETNNKVNPPEGSGSASSMFINPDPFRSNTLPLSSSFDVSTLILGVMIGFGFIEVFS